MPPRAAPCALCLVSLNASPPTMAQQYGSPLKTQCLPCHRSFVRLAHCKMQCQARCLQLMQQQAPGIARGQLENRMMCVSVLRPKPYDLSLTACIAACRPYQGRSCSRTGSSTLTQIEMRWAAASAPREVRSKPHSEKCSPNKMLMAAISGLYQLTISHP
jgi:hypothetical protein